MSTRVSRKLQHISNAPVQATPGVGSVNFWSFTVACTRGGGGLRQGPVEVVLPALLPMRLPSPPVSEARPHGEAGSPLLSQSGEWMIHRIRHPESDDGAEPCRRSARRGCLCMHYTPKGGGGRLCVSQAAKSTERAPSLTLCSQRVSP